MASHLVGQHQLLTFISPVLGTQPIDANVVRGNDNTLRTATNAHDNDETLHVQDSLLASRPAFGTEGRKWLTTDPGSLRLFYDTGAAWSEFVAGSVVGTLTFGTHLTSGGASYNGSANVTITSDATSANTASAIVARDSAGAFAMGALTATAVTVTAVGVVLDASGATTATRAIKVASTGVTAYFGIENSIGTSFGAAAYSPLIYSDGPLISLISPNGVKIPTGGLTVSAGTTAVQALTAAGLVLTVASAAGSAGFRMPSGAAPTSPVSGDFWYNGTNLCFRDGGTTRTLTWV